MDLEAAALAAAVIAGTLLVGFSVAAKGVFSDVTAAWVQAVGSIWAVLAVWRFSTEEARRAEEAAFQQVRSRIETALHVAHEARELARETVARLKGPNRLPKHDFEDVRETLDRIPIDKLGSGRLALRVRQLRRLVEHLWLYYDSAASHNEVGTEDEEVMRRHQVAVERIYAAYDEIERLCDQVMADAAPSRRRSR